MQQLNGLFHSWENCSVLRGFCVSGLMWLGTLWLFFLIFPLLLMWHQMESKASGVLLDVDSVCSDGSSPPYVWLLLGSFIGDCAYVYFSEVEGGLTLCSLCFQDNMPQTPPFVGQLNSADYNKNLFQTSEEGLCYHDNNLMSGSLEALIHHLVPTLDHYPDVSVGAAFLSSFEFPLGSTPHKKPSFPLSEKLCFNICFHCLPLFSCHARCVVTQ